MDFEKLTGHAIGMTRHLFKEQGHIHDFALFDRGAHFGIYAIAKDVDTDEATARLTKVIRDNDIPGYAVIYEAILSGSADEEKLIEEGARALGHVTPVGPVSLSDLANLDPESLPNKVIFITLATQSGDRKTLMLPVTGDRDLGPVEDVTDELHSLFSEVYNLNPPVIRI